LRRKKVREVNIFSASVVDLFASGLGVFLIVSIIALVNQKKESAKLGQGGDSSVVIEPLEKKISELEIEIEKVKDRNFILNAKAKNAMKETAVSNLKDQEMFNSKQKVDSKLVGQIKENENIKLENQKLLEQIKSKVEEVKDLKKEIQRISLINSSQGKDAGQIFSQYQVGDKVTLDDVRFYPGTDRPIEPYASREISRFAYYLNDNPNITVEVSGHIFETKKAINENKADDVYNLSGRRAKAVCFKLVEFGVSDKRLSCIGYGANRPVFLTNDQYSEKAQKNRRVEIEFLTK
jgi:outer membrane protein OmpA-like peptidoglycan-associated protein